MSDESSPSPLLAQVAGMLEADEWNHQIESEETLIGEVSGEAGTWNYRVHVLDEPGEVKVRVISWLPVKIPELRRNDVAEFLTRLNVDFTVGYFFLTFDDGKVGYFTNIDLMDGVLTVEMFRRIFYANLHTVDADLAPILSVAYGQLTPLEAYKAVSENVVADAEAAQTQAATPEATLQ